MPGGAISYRYDNGAWLNTAEGPEAGSAHDGSLDLVRTQERILKIFRITGLTKVFGIHETVDQAIAAKGQ